ncbi:MAG TPA: hypothetical protein PKM73_02765 [Verrucomicrobiota bacterium]|nr:hypothetical protein [Verrucomicrobiota bacterium]HNU49654.1 hypothetical protein [Verrucomicrobiota bacterium]
MSEIKFSCEKCNQHILVDSKDAGRKLVCPSCGTQIVIPKPAAGSPRKARTKVTGPGVGAPPEPAMPSGGSPAPALPPGAAAEAPVEVAPEVPSPPAMEMGPGPEPIAKSPGGAPVQVAVLTPEVKLEIVRAAQALISEPGRWVTGMGEDGKLTYAARSVTGQLARVEVDSPEATHYSLMGAILCELQRHSVTTTATGRTAFLDQEIPAAIQKVIGAIAPTAGQGKVPESTDQQLMSIGHAQCLKVLDELEREYAAQAGGNGDSTGLRELRGVSLEELMVRAAKDEAISSTELLRAVHRELTELNRRLSELEAAAGTSGPVGSTS